MCIIIIIIDNNYNVYVYYEFCDMCFSKSEQANECRRVRFMIQTKAIIFTSFYLFSY